MKKASSQCLPNSLWLSLLDVQYSLLIFQTHLPLLQAKQNPPVVHIYPQTSLPGENIYIGPYLLLSSSRRPILVPPWRSFSIPLPHPLPKHTHTHTGSLDVMSPSLDLRIHSALSMAQFKFCLMKLSHFAQVV